MAKKKEGKGGTGETTVAQTPKGYAISTQRRPKGERFPSPEVNRETEPKAAE